MPAIVIKDHQWRQTEKKIIIHVPLKGRPKNVDLFAMDNYVKISFQPFILELFLWGNVLEEESKCTLTDTEAIFSLHKINELSHWPSLELENIDKKQKCAIREQILEKLQSVLKSHTTSKKEKLQHLQKEAIKLQINLDTDTLNRIEILRDFHRRAAMQDLEDWRLNAELSMLNDIPGEVQENRKAYRSPFKWMKDDLGIVQSWETGEKNEINKKREIEDQRDESIVIEKIKEESTVGKITKKEPINKKERKSGEPTIRENLTTESIHETNLKEDTDINENIQEETLKIKKTAEIYDNSFNHEKDSSCSEDSESDYKMTSSIHSTNLSIKNTDKRSLQKSYMKKRSSNENLIDKILKYRYSRMNRIFDEPEKAIPLPRRSGTIIISFSERAFPTPARESSLIQEQEWLSKQAEARRKTGFVVENLRPEEQDPQWLKDKGDDFFKAGNYLAAISAYTHGIKISSKMAALYVNRSAAHYALGNYYRCIDDCSTVLELMDVKCESNRISRARCHARRGAALCKLSAPQHGIPELEAALKLEPDNESIKRDLYAARQYFNVKE